MSECRHRTYVWGTVDLLPTPSHNISLFVFRCKRCKVYLVPHPYTITADISIISTYALRSRLDLRYCTIHKMPYPKRKQI